jgi:hypothetical protein
MDASLSLRSIMRTAGRDGASEPIPRPFRLCYSSVHLLRLGPAMGQPARLVTVRLAFWPAKRWKAAFESGDRASWHWTKKRLGPFILGFQLIDGRAAYDASCAEL